jgi:hypothetical protein
MITFVTDGQGQRTTLRRTITSQVTEVKDQENG